MNTTVKTILLALAALMAAAGYFYFTGDRHTGRTLDRNGQERDDSDNGDTTTSDIASSGANIVIKLSEDIQKQAAIRLVPLESIQHRSEMHATGRIVDIQPLLDMRLRYHEIQGQRQITSAALQSARQDLERLQQLHAEAGNISGRELQQARLQWESKSAEYRASTVRLEDLRYQFVQAWGKELTGLFLDDNGAFSDLSARKTVLVLVTLPGGAHLDENAKTAFISPGDERHLAVEAGFISISPATDTRTQGATYFFQAPAGLLRTGMNVDVWIPTGNELQQGVLIPPAAVIWYMDRPWVYVAIDAQTFARAEVKKYTATRGGWFVTEGFRPGDNIVTSGAQMLLSQEFRWSIPDEDDNP